MNTALATGIVGTLLASGMVKDMTRKQKKEYKKHRRKIERVFGTLKAQTANAPSVNENDPDPYDYDCGWYAKHLLED